MPAGQPANRDRMRDAEACRQVGARLGSGLAATAVSRNAWRRYQRLARLPTPVIPLRNRLVRRSWLRFSERGLRR